jgi:predicted membrane-bound dolichyl-phosphate-mannose-protein mannosyltransferase
MPRKIEQQMNDAISTETDWHKDNTQVINIEGVSFVYLYSNLIAMVGETWLELFDGGYKSNTTKSRLNAILQEHGNGERVYAKNYQWFVSTSNGEVAFGNGIKLD